MAEKLTIHLCKYCQMDIDDMTHEEMLSHAVRLIEDLAIVEAFQIIHGAQSGLRQYVQRGGLIHLTETEVRESMARAVEQVPVSDRFL